MLQDRVELLHRIFSILGLKEIPTSIVKRRLTIFDIFEIKKESFHDDEFVEWFAEVNKKGKSFNKDNITAATIFNFINENQDLWEEAFKLENIITINREDEKPQDLPERYQTVIERNDYTPQPFSETNGVVQSVLTALVRDKPEYNFPEFEKEILYKLEGYENLSDQELLIEATKAIEGTIFKEDGTTSYRFLFEEFKENEDIYSWLGVNFRYPSLNPDVKLEGKVSILMGAAYLAFNVFGPVFELKRIVRTANRIARVNFTEKETIEFFRGYLDGNLDHILLKGPPDNFSYFLEVEKTIDYDYHLKSFKVLPNIEYEPAELSFVFRKLFSILLRAKAMEWTKNVPIGDEKTILDLLADLQHHSGLIEDRNDKLLSLKDMLDHTDKNVIEEAVHFFARDIAYSYLLRVNAGGIEKTLLDAIKNLSGAPRGVGNQLLSIKTYYQKIYPDDWQKQFFYNYMVKTASKGLSTSTKRTVTERLNLLVSDKPRQIRGGISFGPRKTGEKVPSDVIFKKLRQIKFLNPTFKTPEEAQTYLKKTFSSVKIELNKAWLKNILRKGFELYIERPVSKAWVNEMEDLYRELIRFYQDLVMLERPSLELNELIVESLREALNIPSLSSIDPTQKDFEVLSLFLKLPENPVLVDRDSVEQYLNIAFDASKPIINSVINREVQEEVERKTFIEEIEERISLDNTVIDWFVRAHHSYSEIIDEPVVLERTSDPNDVLLKTIYGGVIFLVEDSMKGLLLSHEEKIKKASFLKTLFSKQIHSIKKSLAILDVPYSIEILLKFILEQITLWNDVYNLRGIIADLEKNNRIINSLGSDNPEQKNILSSPGIRSLLARELVVYWIKSWANSVLNLYDQVQKGIDIKNEEQEQETLQMFFYSTGRDDIRNFIYPAILGNIKEVTGFESGPIFDFNEYSVDVFPEAVHADAQLVMYLLYEATKELTEKRLEDSMLDFTYYIGTQIESSKKLIGLKELTFSDVVKKATGLSLSGLTLQSIVFQLGNTNINSIASYIENPFEGSQITGLTLELISKENIPLGLLHPLTQNASQTLAGLIERNPRNASNPDKLYLTILTQLLDEADLVLFKDSGTLQDNLTGNFPRPKHSDISRTGLKVSTAYKMKIKEIGSDLNVRIIPEEVQYWGTSLIDFGSFVQLLVPFFEPAQIIKNKLIGLKISDDSGTDQELMLPSLLVFDDNGKYKVVIIEYKKPFLCVLIAEEDNDSKMGLRTLQYLLKTRINFFEDLVFDFSLMPLTELNRSFPLNRIRTIKGDTLDYQLIKNISLGAI
ncbi:MAG: hypothetical protein ACTSW1_06375 [Candidatus Hodarchaeales archaeon]